MATGKIQIGARLYPVNPSVDRFQVPVAELGDLSMAEIPRRSHLEVMNLPVPNGGVQMEFYALHAATEHEDGELSIYGGFTIEAPREHRKRLIARLRRSFPEVETNEGLLAFPVPHITWQNKPTCVSIHLFYRTDYSDKRQTRVRDAVAPFYDGIVRFNRPSVHAFICHASEDKAAARDLASGLSKMGADVWFDEWEIRVGESIVQKINAALGNVSHLIVLLSVASVEKPWVKKEMSSALMRQLTQGAVTVLPVILDDASVPPILADVKFADARRGVAAVLPEIESALFAEFESENEA